MKKRIAAAVSAALLLTGCTYTSEKTDILQEFPAPGFITNSESSFSYSKPEIADVVQSVQSSMPASPSASAVSSNVSPSSVPEASSSSEASSSAASESTPSSQPVSAAHESPYPGSILNDLSAKWAYNSLNEDQQIIYRGLLDCANESTRHFHFGELVNIDKDSVYEAFWAFDYDNPQFLELGKGYRVRSMNEKNTDIFIDYGRSSAEVPQEEFDSAAREIIAEAAKLGSDYERVKYIHDVIINSTEYHLDGTLFESEADGVVCYGKACCEGYSKAFMYFTQALGIECVCVTGSGLSENHMWNMVKVDGAWYNVDVTWDDPVRTDGTSVLHYNYFLISDAQLSLDHTLNNPFPVPSAPNSYEA